MRDVLVCNFVLVVFWSFDRLRIEIIASVFASIAVILSSPAAHLTVHLCGPAERWKAAAKPFMLKAWLVPAGVV